MFQKDNNIKHIKSEIQSYNQANYAGKVQITENSDESSSGSNIMMVFDTNRKFHKKVSFKA